MEDFHLPQSGKARPEFAATIAAAGQKLLTALDAALEQSRLREVPAVKTLRQVWAER